MLMGISTEFDGKFFLATTIPRKATLRLAGLNAGKFVEITKFPCSPIIEDSDSK